MNGVMCCFIAPAKDGGLDGRVGWAVPSVTDVPPGRWPRTVQLNMPRGTQFVLAKKLYETTHADSGVLG